MIRSVTSQWRSKPSSIAQYVRRSKAQKYIGFERDYTIRRYFADIKEQHEMTVLKSDDYSQAILRDRRTKLLQILAALPVNLYLFINDYYMASTILCLLIIRRIRSRQSHPLYLTTVMQLKYDGAARDTVRAVMFNGEQKLFSVEKIVPVSDVNTSYFALKRWIESQDSIEVTPIVGLKGEQGNDHILEIIKEDLLGTYFDAFNGVEVKANDRPERFFFYFKYEGELYTVWFLKIQSTTVDLMELMRIITGGRFREPKAKPDMVKLISEQIKNKELTREQQKAIESPALEIDATAPKSQAKLD